MLTYWLLFMVPAWAALLAPARPRAPARRLEVSWLFAGLILVLLIGLRHQVGGDWATYERQYLELVNVPFQDAFKKGDPGYYMLVWLSGQIDGGIYLVNFVSAIIFTVGLVVFCRQQPRPWLALAVAVPYTVIVLGMGYTRQGVALGLALIGMVSLARHSTVRFVVYVTLAATFHKSAILLIPLAMLATPHNRIWTVLWTGVSAILLYWTLLADSVDSLMTSYVTAEYQSEGAAVRIAMNAVPAVLILLLRNRLQQTIAERNLWTMMSIAALATVGILMVSPSSTAVDRVALYLLPLQIYLFARLPDLLGKTGALRSWVFLVVVYYAIVQLVWLNFAHHSGYWVPYQFYPFMGV